MVFSNLLPSARAKWPQPRTWICPTVGKEIVDADKANFMLERSFKKLALMPNTGVYCCAHPVPRFYTVVSGSVHVWRPRHADELITLSAGDCLTIPAEQIYALRTDITMVHMTLVHEHVRRRATVWEMDAKNGFAPTKIGFFIDYLSEPGDPPPHAKVPVTL
jgi:mannose-6-phosphate isomerase-like protein (cupin superfamily)